MVFHEPPERQAGNETKAAQKLSAEASGTSQDEQVAAAGVRCQAHDAASSHSSHHIVAEERRWNAGK